MATVTLAEAIRICDAAIARAEEIGIRVSVSVVDSGSNLLATHRMDGSIILGVEGSRGKAVASVIFGQPSGELEARADRPTFRAILLQYGGKFIMGQGAVPISRDGQIAGACGVGGGTPQEDEDCARVGIAAIGAQWP